MMSPFHALLTFIGMIFMLVIVYKVRANFIDRGYFNNDSYQLGIIFGVVCYAFVQSMVSLMIWLTP